MNTCFICKEERAEQPNLACNSCARKMSRSLSILERSPKSLEHAIETGIRKYKARAHLTNFTETQFIAYYVTRFEYARYCSSGLYDIISEEANNYFLKFFKPMKIAFAA